MSPSAFSFDVPSVVRNSQEHYEKQCRNEITKNEECERINTRWFNSLQQIIKNFELEVNWCSHCHTEGPFFSNCGYCRCGKCPNCNSYEQSPEMMFKHSVFHKLLKATKCKVENCHKFRWFPCSVETPIVFTSDTDFHIGSRVSDACCWSHHNK